MLGKENMPNAVYVENIDERSEGQRIDNFLFKHLKGVPKSHIYQILRSGQVRVNSKRVTADYRLQLHDAVRIPPLKLTLKSEPTRILPRANSTRFEKLYEDEWLIAINKPAGMAVHGGSGVSYGIIEQLRQDYPEWKFLELVHRLDRDTSGVLMLAKKRSALVGLHQQIREGSVQKFYWVIVKGKWTNAKQSVKLLLNKFVTAKGERRVTVTDGRNQDTKDLFSHTIFTLEQSWPDYSLLKADLKTGRTHQIRVHLAHLGFPIVGDEKYGDFDFNRQLMKKNQKIKRMFLHAGTIAFIHPITNVALKVTAPLSKEWDQFIDWFKRESS